MMSSAIDGVCSRDRSCDDGSTPKFDEGCGVAGGVGSSVGRYRVEDAKRVEAVEIALLKVAEAGSNVINRSRRGSETGAGRERGEKSARGQRSSVTGDCHRLSIVQLTACGTLNFSKFVQNGSPLCYN
jgi:hypothetical protein